MQPQPDHRYVVPFILATLFVGISNTNAGSLNRAWKASPEACEIRQFSHPRLVPFPGCYAGYDGVDKANCSDGPQGIRICKCLSDREDAECSEYGVFHVQKDGKTIQRWYSSAFLGALDDFEAMSVDLDGDGHRELVIANRTSETLGMGVLTWSIAIIGGLDVSSSPIVLVTEDYGEGSLARLGGMRGCQLLITDWGVHKPDYATYFSGVWLHYQKGEVSPAKNYPMLARRYLFSFEGERNHSFEGYRAKPLKWLLHPKAKAVNENKRSMIKREPLSCWTNSLANSSRGSE